MQLAAFRSAEESRATLELAFVERRTATLHLLAGSMKLFLRWARMRHVWPALPVTEPEAFAYALHWLLERAPPTRLTRFSEDLAFCKGVVGLDGAAEVLENRRLQGAAYGSHARERLLTKRIPPKASWVRLLEAPTFRGADPGRRVTAGHSCFVLHVRARRSDAQVVVAEPPIGFDRQGGAMYVVVEVTKTRTSNAPH